MAIYIQRPRELGENFIEVQDGIGKSLILVEDYLV